MSFDYRMLPEQGLECVENNDTLILSCLSFAKWATTLLVKSVVDRR